MNVPIGGGPLLTALACSKRCAFCSERDVLSLLLPLPLRMLLLLPLLLLLLCEWLQRYEELSFQEKLCECLALLGLLLPLDSPGLLFWVCSVC